jgi:4-amino-4-deoxy-L-arabinose transferase-like glycosyltransferase
MGSVRLPRWVFVLIGLISVVRLIAAVRIPLTPDEAYYWTWSRHLDFAYTDHPPAVAWLIALTAPLGNAPGLVRLPFILCEAGAALALGATATALSRSAAAGAAAALAFALVPQTKLAIGEALPDGPYVLCWALALLFAVRLSQPARPDRRGAPLTAVLLGIAMGGAILSRFFGWALVAGIAAHGLTTARRSVQRDVALACLVAVILYIPFLLRDAAHGWQNIAFTLHQRHDFHAVSAGALGGPAAVRFIVYVLLFWLVGYVVALRPRLSLVAWTALPFPTLLAFLAPFDPVEAYWLLGPFASLCVGIGIAVARLSLPRRRALGIAAALPAAATIVAVLFAALDAPVQASALHALGDGAKGPLYNSVYMFRPLAEEVRSMTNARSAAAVTDRLEIAAELRYDDVPASMIGTAPQVAQWNRWYDAAGALAPRALIVTYAPLESDAVLDARVHRAYAHVEPSVAHRYDFAGTAAGTFFLTWCDEPRTGASRP